MLLSSMIDLPYVMTDELKKAHYAQNVSIHAQTRLGQTCLLCPCIHLSLSARKFCVRLLVCFALFQSLCRRRRALKSLGIGSNSRMYIHWPKMPSRSTCGHRNMIRVCSSSGRVRRRGLMGLYLHGHMLDMRV